MSLHSGVSRHRYLKKARHYTVVCLGTGIWRRHVTTQWSEMKSEVETDFSTRRLSVARPVCRSNVWPPWLVGSNTYWPEAHAFQVGSQSLAVGVIGILRMEVQIPHDEAIACKDVLFTKNLEHIVGPGTASLPCAQRSLTGQQMRSR